MKFPPKLEHDILEEGEYGPFDDYDPAYEFPGDHSQPLVTERASCLSPPPTALAAPPLNNTTTLRLVVLKSSVLSSSKRVAVLDGHAEVSIGRDVALTARIRLKEMAVSKFHVSIYWDGAKREWGIVDRGSMHGTYVRSTRDNLSLEQSQGIRLSPPRTASLPKVLKHLDEITVGRTTFRVHEHVNCRPCLECTIDDKGEIPLFTSGQKPSVAQPSTQDLRKRKLAAVDDTSRDPRKAMAKLKSSLMSRHQLSDTKVPTSLYKDQNRDKTPKSSTSLIPQSAVLPPPPIHRRIVLLPDPSPLQDQPPAPPPPISSDSIGHKLLLSQGWNPGTALGENPTIGLVEPLEIQQRSHRAGLGAQSSSKLSSETVSKWIPNWHDEAKRRR